ncbi:MAG: response regulator, partial [Magnetococcales bacterium]|nr:response regulator [Magnetococcales bacterium]
MARNISIFNMLQLNRLGIRGRLTLILYLLTFFSMGVVGYYGYNSAANAYREGAKDSVLDRVSQISDKINEFNYLTQNDLNFFSNYFSLFRQLYWLDMKDTMKHEHWKVITVDTWLDFVKNYDYLYKVRFIGLDGQERITIRRDPRTRKVIAIPKHELQDRSEENYFKNSVNLAKNSFTISKMDLNREHGRIEKPLVPVIRLSRPVFGKNNVRYGVVVVNIFADAVFEYIRDIEKNLTGVKFYLIDKNGEFLYHASASKSFSHLLGHGDNFRTLFPGILKKLQNKEVGALFVKGQVLGFERIFPHSENKENYWTLVSTINEKDALSGLTNFKIIFFTLVLLMLALVFITSFYYVRGLMGPILFITDQLQRMGKGQVKNKVLAYNQHDEIRQMLDSTELLVNNMELLANQADTIAMGDLSSDVQLLSDDDRLGNAINNMTSMLRKSRLENEQQNWLRDGISRLSEKLTGDLSPQLLAEKALSIIGQYLGSGRGVFYVYDAKQDVLELLGSYMFTQRSHLANRFSMGEGAVGQAAKERKPILLTVQDEDETAPITTGTARTKPLHIYTWPLLREGELLGVVELSGFKPLDALQQEFLKNAIEVVTSFIFMALQRQRINNLFKRAEESTKKAEEQSRQLQESNAQMEEQQQQLQQQTEELQQTNAQMEEQQQQLQQQTEELQQTNAQMEEQRQQVELQSEELRRNNEALRQTQEEVNARAQQLEEANRYKSEFLANMSHELRTPLNAINVISKMMAKNENGNLDEETVKRSQVIHNSGNDLLRLISDILDLSKIEAGRVEIHLEQFPTNELAEEMRALFDETSNDNGVEFVVKDDYNGTITSDRHKIVQILRNLLSNAFKFTHEGQVGLHFKSSGDAKRPLKIKVFDSGIGIPNSELDKIFDAFRQVDGSISRQYGGTGLGLSITKKFIDMLDAVIEVHSTQGEGSEFILLMPVQLESSHAVPQQQLQKMPQKVLQPAKEEPSHSPQEDRKTILVIDDDSYFCENIAAINRHNNYKTLSAKTGKEGLAMARSHHPAGIILDLGLPDMPGQKVLEQIKTDSDLKKIPVYIISAQDKSLALLEQGAIGFLQKPVSDNQIVTAEASLLNAVKPGQNSLLIIEGSSLTKRLIEENIQHTDGSIVAVNSASEGLEMISREKFDLVLTDHHLSDMDCAEFCEKLQDRQPNLSIIIFSENSLDEERLSQLRQFTDSIIQQAPQANKRISRDIERFLNTTITENEDKKAESQFSTEKTLKDKRMLVVDDDPRNLYVLTASLEQNGAQVFKSLNGRKAIELLGREKIDLVFMDIMMPEMNGYDAIKTIRLDPALKNLPIIALTAKA